MTEDATAQDGNDGSEVTSVASYATRGEAEVAQAKLRAYGIESALDDQVEGGSVPIDGEDGVFVDVRDEDADDAREIPDSPAGVDDAEG